LPFDLFHFQKSKLASSAAKFPAATQPMKAPEVERVIVTPQYRFAPIKITQRVHIIYLISPAK
jgi:hypothetical protein